MNRRLVKVLLAALFLSVFALPASAQVFTGRIDVTAVDSTGAVLPGVMVEISGAQASNAVTDARGDAHFLNLAPGKYTVVAKLTGFGDYTNSDVLVGAGSNVILKATLGVAGVTATENVKAETPIIDTKKVAVSTNISLDELQNIPSSRDPWVVLQTVPGVIVDRVNVGGAESGQQSNFQAKGAAGGDNTWNMDGIAITDMAALGSSPTYYDFDMFSEMQVSTGGADITTATPGVSLNMVLRSGTNAIKGSGRYYWEGKDTQADNVASADRGILASYNRIKEYKDYGGEAGGPIVKNKVWVWGAYGKTQPKLQIFTRCTASNTGCSAVDTTKYGQSAKDETILENMSGKLTGQLTGNTRLSATYFRGNKEKFGRGAAANRPDETTMNQTGPTSLYKGEVNMTVNNNMFVSARYAHVAGGFSLTPRGGDAPVFLDDTGIWHGSFYFYATERPQNTGTVEATVFKGNHDLKFGFGYRKAAVTSESSWPGGGIITFHSGYPSMNAEIVRQHHTDASTVYMNGYIGDPIPFDRLTLTLGARWDRQVASINAIQDPANTNDPGGLLPQLSGAAASNAIKWNSISPRLGLTYALDQDRHTILRGSYAMFASQINATQASVLSTVQYSYTYYVNVTDANGNKIADKSELAGGTLAAYTGFDLANPAATTTPNKIGDYNTPKTHEVVLGVDHQILRDFAVGGSFTWRKYTDFNRNHLQGVDGSKYSQAGTYTCVAAEVAIVGPCSVPYYKLDKATSDAAAGTIYEGRPGYSQRFTGFDLYATKRMSNNWMARLAFSNNVHREYFKDAAAHNDLTPTAAAPNMDGGLVVTQTGGSGKSQIFLVLPKYQFIANAAYQLKWGFTAGMNYLYRQGYAEPFNHSAVATGDPRQGNKSVLLVGGIDWFRLKPVHSLDARLGKSTKINRFTIDIDIDAFNLFNLNTALGRVYDLRLSTRNQVQEIMNPRIVRIGARIGF